MDCIKHLVPMKYHKHIKESSGNDSANQTRLQNESPNRSSKNVQRVERNMRSDECDNVMMVRINKLFYF